MSGLVCVRAIPSYLVEEDILAVMSVHREILEHAIVSDAMLLAQLVPEGSAD